MFKYVKKSYPRQFIFFGMGDEDDVYDLCTAEGCWYRKTHSGWPDYREYVDKDGMLHVLCEKCRDGALKDIGPPVGKCVKCHRHTVYDTRPYALCCLCVERAREADGFNDAYNACMRAHPEWAVHDDGCTAADPTMCNCTDSRDEVDAKYFFEAMITMIDADKARKRQRINTIADRLDAHMRSGVSRMEVLHLAKRVKCDVSEKSDAKLFMSALAKD